MNVKKRFLLWILSFAFFVSPSYSYAENYQAENKEVLELRLLETTDLHANLVNYDYYQTTVDNKIGLVKTASLIKLARREVKNSLLFDNGDHLVGNPLGEYLARIGGIQKGKTHPVYRAFNHLGYDAIGIGNHEFNYGLQFLTTVLKGLKMPVVNANVYSIKKNQPLIKPYVILKRDVVDGQGNKHKLKIGVIGVMPTQIMKWDRSNLEGKVFAKPIVETAEEYVPLIKSEGADIIVVLAHTGIDNLPYHAESENGVYYLAKIPGIDVILAGHSHSVFPGPVYKDLPNTNIDTGIINGKPVVMAGAFGSRLGIIDLQLQYQSGKWQIIKAISSTRPIADENGASMVKTDRDLYKLIKKEHHETVDYIKKIGL